MELKPRFLFWLSIVWLSFLSFTNATSQISPFLQVDVKLPQTETKVEQDIGKSYSLKTAKFCVGANKVLNDFLIQNKDYINQRYFNRGILYENMKAMPLETEVKVAGSVAKWTTDTIAQQDITNSISKENYSWTNLQVANVDEPEIIKMDNNNIIYLDKRSWKVYIVEQGENVDDYKVKSFLNIPSSFWVENLFYHNKKIIILGQRQVLNEKEAFFDNINRTTILMFDVSNPEKPVQLEEVIESPGMYDDARIFNGNLYFVSNIYANPYWNYQPVYWIKEGATMKNNKLKNVDIEKDLKPLTLLSIKDKKITENKVKYDCSNIYFSFPNKETIEKYGLDLEFKIITKVNLSNLKEVNQNIIVGSGYNLYMSPNAMYVANNLSLNIPYSRWWRYIGTSAIGDDIVKNYTAIHKFNVTKSGNLAYGNSTILPGSPLNQYSMDEHEGNFRIITNISRWDSEKKAGTNVYILDNKLSLLGKLEGIKPEESFKSSRFIGNMLYFVTFEQIDPFFVADLIDIKNPKIIGELKIPWYSSYLHPYAFKDGKQYLIGLGMDTEELEKDRIQEIGVKVDLYEIDFNNRPISVKQLHTVRLGGQQSYTPALDEFRSFVWDDAKKELTLPIYLTESEKIKRCHSTTDYDSKNKKTVNETCYSTFNSKPVFFWNKVLNIDIEKGIKEVDSENYIDIIKNKLKVKPYMNVDDAWVYYDTIQSSRSLYNKDMKIFLNPYLIGLKKGENKKVIELSPRENAFSPVY